MMKLLLLLPIVIISSIYIIDNAYAIEQLGHRVSIVGSFEGEFDYKMINSVGKFRIGNYMDTFVLTGTFENDQTQHWNPLTGKYVRSSPNCQKIVGELVLQSQETKLNLDFKGKTCQYGLLSFIVGTVDIEGEEKTGSGRITFVADHHTNSVKGQLRGII